MKFQITKNFVNKIRNLVKDGKIILENDADFDLIKHNFTKSLVLEAFVKGLIVEDRDLYHNNPDFKHKGKNYYCLYKYRSGSFFLRIILISFVVKNNVIIFHVSSINYGSKEERYYRENIEKFKELFL